MEKNKNNTKNKIVTILSVTILKRPAPLRVGSSILDSPQRYKRRSTTTRFRLRNTRHSVSGTNINKFIDKQALKDLFYNLDVQNAKDFIDKVGECFPQEIERQNRTKKVHDSKYQDCEFPLQGVTIKLRVSDHNINVTNSIEDDIDEIYSVAIKKWKHKNTFKNDDRITAKEYVYIEDRCDLERYRNILKSIIHFCETSEWDPTIAPADFVNPPDLSGISQTKFKNDIINKNMKEKITRSNIKETFGQFRNKLSTLLRDGYTTIVQGLAIEKEDKSGETTQIIDLYLDRLNNELAKNVLSTFGIHESYYKKLKEGKVTLREVAVALHKAGWFNYIPNNEELFKQLAMHISNFDKNEIPSSAYVEANNNDKKKALALIKIKAAALKLSNYSGVGGFGKLLANALLVEDLDGVWSDNKDKFREQIIEDMNRGLFGSWEKPWKPLYINADGKPIVTFRSIHGRPYTGHANIIFLGATPHKSPFFATEQYVLKHGGKITNKKAYTFVTGAALLNLVDENGSPIIDEDGNEQKAFIRSIDKVYNLDDIEGLKSPKCTPIVFKEKELNQYCEGLLKEMIKRKRLPKIFWDQGDRAYYRPSSDEIHIVKNNQFNLNEEYYSTLFHEIIHSTGHASRANRRFDGKFGSKSYAKEELIAETGALILCSELGLNYTRNNSLAYLKSWLRKAAEGSNIEAELITAYGYAVDAVDYLLKDIDVAKFIPQSAIDKASNNL